MTGRRQPDPARTPECARLAEELRGLRAHTGLSMTALAQRTAYSRSSWERYLNGKALPPRHAVQELSELAGQRPQRMLALWELAELAWSGRAFTATPAKTPPNSPAAPPEAGETPRQFDTPAPGKTRTALTFLAVALAAAGVLAGVVWGLVGGVVWGVSGGGQRAAAPDTAPRCHGDGCAGRSPLLCGPSSRDVSAHSTPEGTWVKIRYSRACGAVWAVVWHSGVGDELRVSVPSEGSTPHAVVVRAFDTERMVPTPMVAARDVTAARVCLRSASTHRRTCFHA
ncbi:DUF2690 domain-containing protein [Streptomyces sp. NPDC026659]|uniref:helix-turn-helix domain-containing protein n=1 Tax=Streptomyces sp. NPDC026659 TaxID=3155123 RepID=UPI0033C6AF1A